MMPGSIQYHGTGGSGTRGLPKSSIDHERMQEAEDPEVIIALKLLIRKRSQPLINKKCVFKGWLANRELKRCQFASI